MRKFKWQAKAVQYRNGNQTHTHMTSVKRDRTLRDTFAAKWLLQKWSALKSFKYFIGLFSCGIYARMVMERESFAMHSIKPLVSATMKMGECKLINLKKRSLCHPILSHTLIAAVSYCPFPHLGCQFNFIFLIFDDSPWDWNNENQKRHIPCYQYNFAVIDVKMKMTVVSSNMNTTEMISIYVGT